MYPTSASPVVRARPLPADGYWPQGLLEAFTLRMSAHGHCVSGSMMMGDSAYAIQQLAYAHSLADDRLRDLAVALFEHFKQRQSGIVHVN